MLKQVKTFFKEISKPMPLGSNFKDYDQYWVKRGFDDAAAPAFNRAKKLAKFIKPNSTILDIGCGSGAVMDYLSKNITPKKIIGIDISKDSVNHVRENGFEAYEIDVLTDEFKAFIKDKKFDYIIITEVLEHIEDPEAVVTAIKSHFTKSIFVSIPNSGYFVHRIRLLFGKFPAVDIIQHIKEHIRFWTMKDFIYWADYYGYTVKNVVASSGLNIKPLRFLENVFPSFFANQIIYELAIKDKK
jgi:methionine biosynthesis protein MetW